MNISELIKSLQEFKDRQGDLPVFIYNEDKDKPLEETDIYGMGIFDNMTVLYFEFNGHEKSGERLDKIRKEAAQKWKDYDNEAKRKYQESLNNANNPNDN